MATICDDGAPIFMLTNWVRDSARGRRLPLEHIVRKQKSDTANLYSLTSHGCIAIELKADINLIDFGNCNRVT